MGSQIALCCFSDFSESIGEASVTYEENLVSCRGWRICEREARQFITETGEWLQMN